jgi:biotin transport system substrate-specific component
VTPAPEFPLSIAIPRLDRSTAAERGLTLADFLVPVGVAERLNARARDVVLVVAGAMFIYLTARIAIPVQGSPVPITGQTFGVLLVGAALGFRRGFLAVSTYVLLGVIGLPFFAEGKGGLSVIWGTNGGYLIGFIVAGAVVGRLAELGWDRRFSAALAAMFVGNVIIYVFGLPWLMVVTGWSVEKTLAAGLTPYLIGDAVKLVLAAALFPAAWWVVGRRPDDR